MNTPSRMHAHQYSDSRRYNQQCVCQICTCGKHLCPKSKLPFSGQTTNHHDYKPYQITPERQTPCNHEYHQRHYDPSALQTSYDLNYRPHKVENQGNYGPKYEYKPRSSRFYGETQYNTSYVRKEVTPQKNGYCSHHYHHNPAKFQGLSTYTAEFKPKTAEKSYNPRNYTYERRKVPFEGQTTYDANYKPHELQVAQNPEHRHICQCGPMRNSKFEGESHYKSNYRPYQIEHEAHCPILDLPQYPRQCSPGRTHVNYSAEKHKWY